MRILTTLIIALSLLCISACEDDTGGGIRTTTGVSIQFTSSFDGEPLVMDKIYPYEEDFKVTFSKFQFFISYLTLTQDDGNGTIMSEVQLLDFSQSNQDSLSALEGLALKFQNIPVENYSGIRIGIGVIADLNRTEPNDYGDTHPLNSEENHRPIWESYIFSKIEGTADLDNDGNFNHSLVYEIASDELYREVSLNQPIALTEEMDAELKLDIDLKKLFIRNASEYLDIESNNLIYEDKVIMSFIADNFQDAITLE